MKWAVEMKEKIWQRDQEPVREKEGGAFRVN